MFMRSITLLLLALSTPACSSGTQAEPTGREKTGARPPLALGVNLGPSAWWNNSRLYANLILGNHWQMALKDGNVQGMPPEWLDADGWVKSMPPGAMAIRTLNHPVFREGFSDITDRQTGKGWFRFRWQTTAPHDDRVAIDNIFLQITNIDAANPLRDLDCREPAMDPKIRFNPAFIDSLRKFSVIRYLGMMNTATTPTLTWAARKQVTNSSSETADGMAVEDLVTIANEAQVSPWFILPYQADDDYVRRFADYVQKNLDPKLVAHVEFSNEVWNSVFYGVYERMEREGLARGLSKDPYEAVFRRYAERTTEIMKIWTEVYKDRPKSLVRIAATQAAYVDSSKIVLGFADTAKWVDALAIAPYFSFDKNKYPLNSGNDNILKGMAESIATTLDYADRHRAIADQFGVRFVTYEAGQHIMLPNDVPILKAINRSPQMETAYRLYIDRWRDRNGDLMVIMNDVSGFGAYGAWGLLEYLGQPIEEAPKARAVNSYLAAANKASK
jgi:hypothetical protein